MTFEDQISDNVRDTSKQYSFSPNKRKAHLAYQFKIFDFLFWGEGRVVSEALFVLGTSRKKGQIWGQFQTFSIFDNAN